PQGGDGLSGRSTGGHHDDHNARGGQCGYQLFEARDVAAGRGSAVPGDLMTRAANPSAHVGTHLAEANESNVHGIAPVAEPGPQQVQPWMWLFREVAC